jgi:hypothetical protein
MGIKLSSGSRCPQSPKVNRSTYKILTMHVGSLPAPEGLTGEAAVRKLVERQRQTGLDIINEGEYTKVGDWLSFTDDRFGGFTAGQRKGPPIVTQGKDREELADFLQVGLRTRHAVLRAGRSDPGGYYEISRPIRGSMAGISSGCWLLVVGCWC